MPSPAPAPLRIAILSWRDTGHPEGGGSEHYAEAMAAGLAQRGHEVTILTARYAGSAASQTRDGYRILRAGGRFTVYLHALLRIALHSAGRFDVLVDVQNGTPFFVRLVTRRPVVVLCHHVHRDQWPIAFGSRAAGRLLAKLGWWLESRLAPRLLRGCRYVTVSEVSRRDLVALGVRAQDVNVVHNGTPTPSPAGARSEVPEIVVLGRVVPHKRIEQVVRAVASLRTELPDLRLTVIGQGWWSREVAAEVLRLGLQDQVDLLGHVNEARKHELLSRAWVLATASVQEGWGLCVVEAATHGTPSVAYRSAGGLAESVVDGVTGLLSDDGEAHLTAALRQLLVDAELRARLGSAARRYAHLFSQDAALNAFERVLLSTQSGRVLTLPDVLPDPRGTSDSARVTASR